MFAPAIMVAATADIRRRAGFAFGREAVAIAAEMVSAEQLGQLLSDPVLVVSFSEDGDRWFVPKPEEIAEFLVALEAKSFAVGAPGNEAEQLAERLAAEAAAKNEDKTEFQTPGGPEARTEGDASPPAPADGQASTGKDDIATDAFDPAGAGAALAAEPEEFREGEVAASTTSDGVATSGKQPEDATQPPVAKPATARRPKKPAA